MPNHCNNWIEITGEGLKEMYKLFPEESEKEIDILEICLPMPEDLRIVSRGGLGAAKRWKELGYPDSFKYSSETGTLDVDTTQKLSLHDTDTRLSDDELSTTRRDYFNRILSNHDKYGYIDWYDWSRVTWGSKWGYYDICVAEKTEDKFSFSATSAWCPNLTALKTISEKWGVHIKTTYSESGMDFSGYFEFLNGKAVKEVESEVAVSQTDSPLSESDFNLLCEELEVYVVGDKLIPNGTYVEEIHGEIEEWLDGSSISYETYLKLCKGEIVKEQNNE